ncbi:MAG TPA: hypothetical protein VGA70_12055 [Longimicrobiales bacterium]|jgi:hypothetical protein
MAVSSRSRIRSTAASLALPAALFLASSGPLATAASGQEILPAVAGGLGGFLVGGYVSVGVATVRARSGNYLDSMAEAVTLASVPMAAGMAAGITLGIRNPDRLGRAGLGGLLGAVVGSTVGALVGRQAWPPPEGAWAGGVIGGAAGLLAGVVIGGTWPDDDPTGAAASSSLRVPVGFTIRF